MKFSNLPISITVLALSFFITSAASAESLNLGRNAKATEQAVAALILTDLYSRAGIDVNVHPMPATRANADALSGKKDGEVGRIQAYVDNNPSLIKVEPAYYYITTTGYAKDGKNLSIKTRDDLKNYKVGIIRGVAHTAAATDGHTNITVVNDSDQLYKMLAAGRIDIALDAGINGKYMLNKLGIKGVSPVGDLAKLDLFAILNPSKASVSPRLSAVVQSLKDSNELETLVQRHEKEFLESGASN